MNNFRVCDKERFDRFINSYPNALEVILSGRNESVFKLSLQDKTLLIDSTVAYFTSITESDNDDKYYIKNANITFQGLVGVQTKKG